MEKYIAVDSGKFATKAVEYDITKNAIRKFSFRTRVGEGDFRDDAIENNTVIVEIDGKTYKIGNGAKANDVELDTDKKSEIHKLCILTAIATLVSSNQVDEVNVAIGLPAKDWSVVSKRIDFKEYMLPSGEITISFKKNSDSNVEKKIFKIKRSYVFPESIGALFMDETIQLVSNTSIIGVLDIGNLNLNATLWQGVELVQEKSSTADLGGAILIQELSQELSFRVAACDELITANILKDHSGDRHLPDNMNLSKEQVEESREIIKRVLREHAEKIKRTCRGRNWSLDVTKLIAIGGTSEDIAPELQEAFGNIIILPEPNFCNALGYLRLMCTKIPEINKIIPLDLVKSNAKEKK